MKRNVYWKRLVLYLCLGWVSIWIYRTMLTPVYEEIQGTIGNHSGLQMGMISSLYFLGYVIMQVPGGLLMDRFGKKKILLPGFCLFALGIGVTGIATTIEMIYAGSILAGVGTGTYYSGAFSLSGEYVPPQYKYFSTSIINNGCAIGMMIGYLSSGVLVKQWGVSWKIIVFVAGLFVVAMIGIFVVGLEDELPAKREQGGEKEKLDFKLFFSLKMMATYFLYFSACYGYYMIVTWLPSFLETERGMEGSMASIYACIVALVSIPGAMLLGGVLDRFAEKRIILMTLLQCGSACMIVMVTKTTWLVMLILSLGLYGLCGKQAIDPLIVPHVSGIIPKKVRSTGLGIFNFFGMSGSVLAPGITGFAEDLYGSKVYGFYLAVMLLIISAVLFYVSNRNGHNKD